LLPFSKIKVLILAAVTLFNEPYYNEEGDLVFRPGGHGALIENLNSSKSDIFL
jgi:putative intracellular protease/amidase